MKGLRYYWKEQHDRNMRGLFTNLYVNACTELFQKKAKHCQTFGDKWAFETAMHHAGVAFVEVAGISFSKARKLDLITPHVGMTANQLKPILLWYLGAGELPKCLVTNYLLWKAQIEMRDSPSSVKAQAQTERIAKQFLERYTDFFALLAIEEAKEEAKNKKSHSKRTV